MNVPEWVIDILDDEDQRRLAEMHEHTDSIRSAHAVGAYGAISNVMQRLLNECPESVRPQLAASMMGRCRRRNEQRITERGGTQAAGSEATGARMPTDGAVEMEPGQ